MLYCFSLTPSSEEVSFSSLADKAIDIASSLNVAQHVLLYLSKKETEQLASEVKQNNIAIFPNKVSSGLPLKEWV